MSDDTQIIQEGSLLLRWGSLDAACFERASTWCEYYEPEELETMIAWGGVSRTWIDENIIAPLEGTNASVWYAPANDLEVPRCEIMAISTSFSFGDREMCGFLTVIGGEITSGCVFMEDRHDLILSLADILDEHNYTELTRLAEPHGLSWQHLLPIRYTTHGKNPFGIDSGVLDVPVSPTRTAPSDE